MEFFKLLFLLFFFFVFKRNACNNSRPKPLPGFVRSHFILFLKPTNEVNTKKTKGSILLPAWNVLIILTEMDRHAIEWTMCNLTLRLRKIRIFGAIKKSSRVYCVFLWQCIVRTHTIHSYIQLSVYVSPRWKLQTNNTINRAFYKLLDAEAREAFNHL